MRRSTRLVKRLAALFLVVFIGIESIASIVSSDDGAVFVTKAEFEELKANFDKQINDYSDSIDKKVDGAIANYLRSTQVGWKGIYTPYLEISDKSFNENGSRIAVKNGTAISGKPNCYKINIGHNSIQFELRKDQETAWFRFSSGDNTGKNYLKITNIKGKYQGK